MAEIYKSQGKMVCFVCQRRIEKGMEYTYQELHESRNMGSVAVCLKCGNVGGSK